MCIPCVVQLTKLIKLQMIVSRDFRAATFYPKYVCVSFLSHRAQPGLREEGVQHVRNPEEGAHQAPFHLPPTPRIHTVPNLQPCPTPQPPFGLPQLPTYPILFPPHPQKNPGQQPCHPPHVLSCQSYPGCLHHTQTLSRVLSARPDVPQSTVQSLPHTSLSTWP